jgi:uncharacterized RDD family membrane protein YckC
MSVQGSTGTTVGVTDRTAEATEYAHDVKRIMAFAIDQLVIVPIALVGYFFITRGGPGWIAGGAFTLAYAAVIGFYNRCLRMGVTGQSWGKIVTGTRLLSERTGEPPGVGVAIIRDLFHPLDGFLFLGALLPLWDKRRQTFADKITRTVVVNVERGSRPTRVSLPL